MVAMAVGDINYCCERSQVCNMAGPPAMIEVTASLPPVTVTAMVGQQVLYGLSCDVLFITLDGVLLTTIMLLLWCCMGCLQHFTGLKTVVVNWVLFLNCNWEILCSTTKFSSIIQHQLKFQP